MAKMYLRKKDASLTDNEDEVKIACHWLEHVFLHLKISKLALFQEFIMET